MSYDTQLSTVPRTGPRFIAAWLLLAALAVYSPAAEQTAIETKAEPTQAKSSKPLYTYTLAQDGTPASYDEAMAVASLQGIINRTSPDL